MGLLAILFGKGHPESRIINGFKRHKLWQIDYVAGWPFYTICQ